MTDEYVNRQWLIEEYHRRHQGPPGGALKMIKEAPAADVAPVVRCRDCRHTQTDGFGAIYCEKWDRWEMPPDAYCYLGAKKDEGDRR